jgi:hypothetical protein
MPNNARAGGGLPPPDPAFKERPRAGRGLRLRRSRRRGEDYEDVEVHADGWSGLLLLGVIIVLGGGLLLLWALR